MDKLALIEKHMLDHNRPPKSNQALFDDRMRRVQPFEVYVVAQAVKNLEGADMLPKPTKLVYECKVLSPRPEAGSVPCVVCDGIGLVMGVVYINDGIRMDIVSYDVEVRKDGHYTTRIIGRCGCQNGLVYQLVKGNVMGRTVEPDLFLVNAAKENGWPACFEATQAAQYFNDKARGYIRQGTPGPLKKMIDTIIIQQGEEND